MSEQFYKSPRLSADAPLFQWVLTAIFSVLCVLIIWLVDLNLPPL
jgi:hypothetical protein